MTHHISYRKPSEEAIFASDVVITKKEKNGKVIKMPGLIEKYRDGYGRLYYTSQFGERTSISIGPPDFWVLKESRGVLYWMEWTIKVCAKPIINEEITTEQNN